MTDSWTMSAAGRIYGPFSADQMHNFVGEGRLAAHSLVARAGSSDYVPAGDDPALANLFAVQPHTATPVLAAQPAAVAQPMRTEAPAAKFGRDAAATGSERARFVIFADMKSRSISALEEEIFNLGPAFEIAPQAWIVATTFSLAAVRNVLAQKLGTIDMLFVIDTTHNKATWFNYGPESEARIRKVWSAAPDQSGARKAAE